MRGKYSPTVTAAYMKDQEWWHKFSREAEAWTQYDPEGFDSYGYDKNDVDRAGNNENDYIPNDGDYDLDQDFNNAYDHASDEWGFDGVKPVRK
jgi:hypothetical protein